VIRPEPLDPSDPLAVGFLRVLAEVEQAVAERRRLAELLEEQRRSAPRQPEE